MNADGSGQTPVIDDAGDAFAPAWSPDGTRIAYGGSITGLAGADVIVMNANGSGQFAAAGGTGEQTLPAWTPDGSQIVFQDDSVGGLSIVNADGTGRRPFLGDAQAPDFSPDGTRLAVRRFTGGERLHVVSENGTGGGPVTDFPVARPAWSPDGTRLLYNRLIPFGMGSSQDILTIPSGGGTEVPETTGGQADLAPEWQPIGPVPAITALSPLAAGSPGATLTVDGAGFVRRSVVRWNGQNRPTQLVSLTRLVATLTAADVAAPGTASVTVFTSPSGGGLSAPRSATVSGAPPRLLRITLSSARPRYSWKASRLIGTVRLVGSVERAGRVGFTLARGTTVVQRRDLTLPAGGFTRSIALARALVPGKLTLRLAGAGLAAAQTVITLKAPPEGVASRASISATRNGPAARSLRDRSRIFATFRFAARPKKGRRITTVWVRPGGDRQRPQTTGLGPVVTTSIGSSGQLPAGIWRCELRAGKTLVAVATARLR
jgi:hypothetical protein